MSDYGFRRSDDDQRKHRRRRRSSSGSRRSSSGSTESRNENSLPKQFGKREDHLEEEEEEGNNVLVRMKEGFNDNPLGFLSLRLEDKAEIKVMIRNTKAVRGICTGSIVAFDKHWNLIMRNVHEFYVKPKKTKVPFLLGRKIGDQMPDLPPRVPKVKKERSPEKAAPMDEKAAPMDEKAAPMDEKAAPVVEESAAKAEEASEKAEEASEKAPKKNDVVTNKGIIDRGHAHLFIRGDNIVMISILDKTSNGPVAEKD